MKLLMLGFDGLDYDVYGTFKPQGWTLERLESKVPFTPPAWTSIYTGLTAKQHGVSRQWWDWMRAPKPSLTCFWHVLNKKGYTVELMNLPCTYPPDAVNRFHVAGFPILNSKSQNYVYPQALIRQFPLDYLQHIDVVQWEPMNCQVSWETLIKQMPAEELLSRIIRDSQILLDTFFKLHNPSADLAFIQFSFIDRVLHVKPHAFKDAYLHVNEIVSKLEDKLRPENQLIVSDHGFDPEKWHTPNGVYCYKGRLKTAKYTHDVYKCVLDVFGVN